MFALTPPRGVCHFRELSQLKANLPETDVYLFIYCLKLTLCPHLLLSQTEEHVAGVTEAQSPKPCWLNLLQNRSMDELLINTANKSVIPVCGERATDHTLQSPVSMASTLMHQDRLRGYFASQLSHFPFSLLELFRLKIREHKVATGRTETVWSSFNTALHTPISRMREDTAKPLEHNIAFPFPNSSRGLHHVPGNRTPFQEPFLKAKHACYDTVIYTEL